MNTFAYANAPVTVTALSFRNNGGLKSFPRRIEFENGQQITFIDSGMHYLIQKGQQLIRLFDMSDGQNTYRLRCEKEQEWTLVRVRPATA